MGDPSQVSMDQLLHMLWRRKGILLTSILLSVLAGVVVAKSLPPRYSATGLLILETQQPSVPELKDILSGLTADTAIVRSEAEVLRSPALAAAVAQKLDLQADPEFNPTLTKPSAFNLSDLLKRLNPVSLLPTAWLESIGLTASKPDLPVTAERIQAAVVSTVGRNLDVRNDGRSYAIFVSFDSLSPKTSASVVNGLMQAYIEQQLANRLEQTGEVNAWLGERASILRQQVEEADRAVQEFRKEYAILETTSGTVTDQQLSEMNTQLTTARAERAQTEARYREIKRLVDSPAGVDASNDVLQSPLIQNLRQQEAELMRRSAKLSVKLGQRHPEKEALDKELIDLRAKIASEMQKVAKSVAGEVEVAKAREQALTRDFRTLERQATEIAEAGVKLHQLEQDSQAKRAALDTFMARAEETTGIEGIRRADARIVSRATVPIAPSGPKVTLFVAFAALGGAMLGLLIVMVVNRLDNGVYDADEAVATTNLPSLGIVPAISPHGWRAQAPAEQVLSRRTSLLAETLRGMRAALRVGNGNHPPKIVLIASSLPGEGKTNLAVALGRVAAHDGHRVLLIDGDLRSPSVGKLIGRIGDVALDDVLANGSGPIGPMSVDPRSGLHYLAGRGSIANPQFQVDSTAMRTFVRHASEGYDLVLIDSPPVMRVSDAMFLAELADATIFIVRWKTTSKKIAREAVRRLRSSGAPIVGVVLAQVGGRVPDHAVYGGYGN